MPRDTDKLYDFEATVRHETQDAFLLVVEGEAIWFPKSITEDNGDGTFTCPEWFAIQKEIV